MRNGVASKSFSRWIRHAVAAGFVAVPAGLAIGCATADSGPGGTGTTSASSSSSNGTGASGGGGQGGQGGATGAGGAGGTTSTSSSSSGGGGGGGGGTGGAGGDMDAGADAFVPPTGTADYPAETEQNNLKASANPLAAGTKGFTASLWPLGDIDVFAVDVTPAGSSLRVEVTDGMGGCPPGAATIVKVTGPNGPLASDTDSGQGLCSLLTPAAYPALSGLPAGTYYVQVESANLTPIPFYVLDVQVLAPGCGDGILQFAAGEQCDDGNLVANDGCSPTCLLEGNFATEAEPNNTQATANPLGGYDGVVASIDPIGDQDFFSVDVTVAGSTLSAVVSDGIGGCPGSFDSKIYLYNPAMVEITNDDDSGVAACSAILPNADAAATNLPVGTYTIKVEDYGNNDLQNFYVLSVKVTPPGCGDFLLQVGEQCDDGNQVSGDGCSAACQSEPPYEIEPNNSQAQATPLWPATTKWTGSISPLGDHDYFVFDVPANGKVSLTTHDPGSPATCGFDTMIHLIDKNGIEIASDDDGGVSPCSSITPATYPAASNMAAGTYAVWVQRYNDSDQIQKYDLDITIQ